MKRRISMIIICFFVVALALAGCSGKAGGGTAVGTPEGNGSASAGGEGGQGQGGVISEDMLKLLEEIDSAALEEGSWQDNTLDAWQAATHQLLTFKGMKDSERLGRYADDICMMPGSASVFLSRWLKNQDGEIVYLMERVRCTRNGDTEDEIFAKGPNLAKPEVYAYGNVSCTDELWGMLHISNEEADNDEADQKVDPRWIFVELNDDSTIKENGKKVLVSFLGQDCDSEEVEQFMIDQNGLMYLMSRKMNYQEMDGYKLLLSTPEDFLYIVSPEGEQLYAAKLVKENKDTAEPAFVQLPGGGVGISYFADGGNGRKLTLFRYDEVAKDLTPVASLENSYLTNYGITLSDTGKMISVDSGGVWESDPQGGERTQLYTWKEHGMRLSGVYGLQAVESNVIDIVYSDSEGLHYISLKPVTQQREITELVMAVSSYAEEKCKGAVLRFNQKYPSYHLTLKNDYDSTRLNSELISGNGPVLIDTNLTGFDQLEKYWEPLDGVLERMGLYDALEPKALEAGKIGGTTYGIITDFYLETLITKDPETQNWDYDAFLNYLQAHDERPYVYMDYEANCGSLFVYRFWQHGPNDGVLLNVDRKENYIDTDRFRAILNLARKKCQNQGKLDDKDDLTRLLEGETSFMLAYFFKPSDLALYRMVFGDDAYIVGEPMQKGAAHILRCSDPITIRSTATLEEKKGALLFIKELLSYESQLEASKEINFKFSVRRDVLKERISSLNAESYLDSNIYLGVRNATKLGDNVDPEKDYQRLQELLEHSVPVTNLPKEVSSILWDELDPYFADMVPQTDMIRKLKNRINLFLQEQ